MRGANKLLLPIEGIPMIRRVASTLLAAGFNPVVVVTGFDRENIEAAVAGLDVRLAHNPRWEDGMAATIVRGMAALPADAEGNLLALGDMPFLSVDTLEKLREAFEAHQAEVIIFPQYGGRQANPVLFPTKFFGEILLVVGDRGCKELVRRHSTEAVGVPIHSEKVIADCDTPEDYRRLTKTVEPIDV